MDGGKTIGEKGSESLPMRINMHLIALYLLPHPRQQNLHLLLLPTTKPRKQSQRITIHRPLYKLDSKAFPHLLEFLVPGPRADGARFLEDLEIGKFGVPEEAGKIGKHVKNHAVLMGDPVEFSDPLVHIAVFWVAVVVADHVGAAFGEFNVAARSEMHIGLCEESGPILDSSR